MVPSEVFGPVDLWESTVIPPEVGPGEQHVVEDSFPAVVRSVVGLDRIQCARCRVRRAVVVRGAPEDVADLVYVDHGLAASVAQTLVMLEDLADPGGHPPVVR